MDTREIMALIEYQAGFLVPPVRPGEEPVHIACQVVKEDRGRLLVRVEERFDRMPTDSEIELDVPTDRALFRLYCQVERVDGASEGTVIVHLLVDEIETIQRRKQDRFKVNFPLRFIPLRDDEKPFEVLNRPYGIGRAIDISLGGMRFETESELPTGLRAQFEVRLPNGRIDLYGRIVKASRNQVGDFVYGVKFGRTDSVTSQRLNRLILQFERRARQTAPSSGGARILLRRGAAERGGVRRALPDRWARGGRRRGR